MILTPDQKQYCLNNLAIYYQKVVDQSQNVIKYELLTRLPNPDIVENLESFFGDLTPQESLDITMRQIDISQRIFNNTGKLCSINVDNIVLVEEDLKDKLLDAAKGLTHPVILEFTEIRPMPPADSINSLFFKLKQHNVSIALDDFGTGFNGMSIFADYDFDIIKIDKSLITGIQTRPQKLQILSHMLDLMNALDKQHIVEGVESQSQFEPLCDAGFEAFQGFLFYKPRPVEGIL